MRSSSIKESVSEAWNIGGAGVYKEQLDLLAKHRKPEGKFRVYMTKIRHSYNCDLYYPMSTWNVVQSHFRELTFCKEVPELGHIIEEHDGINYSIHAYEHE